MTTRRRFRVPDLVWVVLAVFAGGFDLVMTIVAGRIRGRRR